MNRMLCRGAFFWSAAFPLWAAPAAPQPSLLGHTLQAVLALALVLGLIIASAWLMRRFSLLPSAMGGQMRVVSGVMVSNRERVVIVEVRDTWLVLGVGGQSVNLLHTMPRPDDVAQTPPAPFADWLQQALTKKLGTKDRA